MIGKRAAHIATGTARSTTNQEELSVLDIYYSILKSELDDVRWEKVNHVRLILANGTYPVTLEQVATKIIDQMLESGRANHHWKRSRSSGKTNGDSGVGAAYDCGES
jgi:anti-sigma28 factor (negative regulator of flagellin synthesis)